MTTLGEMHVRRGRYIGVAPLPGGVTNVCLVRPSQPADGALREPFARIGAVRVAAPVRRRRRRGTIKVRRPSIFLRRKAGDPRGPRAVHRGEREIIARD